VSTAVIAIVLPFVIGRTAEAVNDLEASAKEIRAWLSMKKPSVNS
jgi:hypothetical protein